MLSSHVRFMLLATLLGVVAGCGGSEKPAETAGEKPAGHASNEANEHSPDATEETDAAPPKRATCDDGTCTPCGDALCPSGWYCDESAHGGPACGWLPECAQKSGCACVKKALGCACEEKSGAAHLTCS